MRNHAENRGWIDRRAMSGLAALALATSAGAGGSMFYSSGNHTINEGDVINGSVFVDFSAVVTMNGGLVTLDVNACNGGHFILQGGVVQGFGNACGTFFGGGTFTILGGDIGGQLTVDGGGDVFIEAASFWYDADGDGVSNDPIEIPASGELVVTAGSPLFTTIIGGAFAIPGLRWEFEDGAGDIVNFRHIGGWSGELVLREIGGGDPADLNGDGVVDGADLATMLSQWGTDGAADLNNDGVVNGADLAQLLASWTS